MFKYCVSVAIITSTIVISSPGFSQNSEPASYIKIEEFEPKPGHFTVNHGLSAATTDGKGAGPVIVPWSGTGHAIIAGRSARTNRLSATTGIRYNVQSLFNLSASFSGAAVIEQKQEHGGRARFRTATEIGGVAIGADARLPFSSNRLLATAFGSIDLLQSRAGRRSSGNSATVGSNVWWISDPVIIGATVTWSRALEGAAGPARVLAGRYDAPAFRNLITFSPSVSFAVNPDISLLWGTTISYQDTAQKQLLPYAMETYGLSTALNFGLNYALSVDTLLSLSASAGVSGARTSRIGLSMTYRL